MSNYRRFYAPGATFFFTVNLADRRSRELTDRVADLRLAFADALALQPFRIDAIVILPDHLHCIWTPPQGDPDYSGRWRRVKARFSALSADFHAPPVSLGHKGERGIWQRRFWEHCIRDDADYAAHVDYIHFNPVKHRHVACVRDRPFSSFHRWVRKGVYPLNWAVEPGLVGPFGEAE